MTSVRPLLLLALLAVPPLPGLARPSADFLLGGIQVNEPDHESWLRSLREQGMNTVAVTVYARQGDWDSDHLWHHGFDDAVIDEIRLAKSLDLNVALVLRVALDHAFDRNRFLWHGMIMPRTDDGLRRWFARYRAFVRLWAAIAEREGVDLLAVASELNTLTSTVPLRELPALEEYLLNSEKQEQYRRQMLTHADSVSTERLWVRDGERFGSLAEYLDARIAAHRVWAQQVTWGGGEDAVGQINRRRRILDREWRRLIAETRALYSGLLTYAANFDQYRAVMFWDRLDLIGINAYFELRRTWRPVTDATAVYPELRRGWDRVLEEIADFRASRGLLESRVLFTEIGFTARANSTLAPWAGAGLSLVGDGNGGRLVVWEEQPLDPAERALAVRALYQAQLSRGDDLLAGLLYWKLSTDPSHAEIEPFVVILGGEPEDPLVAELRPFARWQPLKRFKDRAREWLARIQQQ